VTAFFIPGIAGDASVLEDAYRDLRRGIELEMGTVPSSPDREVVGAPGKR
jgi:hypothetical protein